MYAALSTTVYLVVLTFHSFVDLEHLSSSRVYIDELWSPLLCEFGRLGCILFSIPVFCIRYGIILGVHLVSFSSSGGCIAPGSFLHFEHY
jgi:hypothetical protein